MMRIAIWSHRVEAFIESPNGDPQSSSQPFLPRICKLNQKQRATSESPSSGAAACGSAICGRCHGSCLRRAPYSNPVLSFPLKECKWMMMNTHTSGGKCRIPLCRRERSAEQKWIYLACIPGFRDEHKKNSIQWPVSRTMVPMIEPQRGRHCHSGRNYWLIVTEREGAAGVEREPSLILISLGVRLGRNNARRLENDGCNQLLRPKADIHIGPNAGSVRAMRSNGRP